MVNIYIYFKELNDEIKSFEGDEQIRQNLIDKYNGELDLLMGFLRKPLPEECELDNDLILEDYKIFKERYNKYGYFTFKKLIARTEIIAEVKVKKVKRWHKVIHADVIRVYKGQIPESIIFRKVTFPLKPYWFYTGETYLVFLDNFRITHYGSVKKFIRGCLYSLHLIDFEGYSTSLLRSGMQFTTENNEQYIVCDDSDPEFWGSDSEICIFYDKDKETTKVKHSEAIKQLFDVC